MTISGVQEETSLEDTFKLKYGSSLGHSLSRSTIAELEMNYDDQYALFVTSSEIIRRYVSQEENFNFITTPHSLLSILIEYHSNCPRTIWLLFLSVLLNSQQKLSTNNKIKNETVQSSNASLPQIQNALRNLSEYIEAGKLTAIGIQHTKLHFEINDNVFKEIITLNRSVVCFCLKCLSAKMKRSPNLFNISNPDQSNHLKEVRLEEKNKSDHKYKEIVTEDYHKDFANNLVKFISTGNEIEQDYACTAYMYSSKVLILAKQFNAQDVGIIALCNRFYILSEQNLQLIDRINRSFANNRSSKENIMKLTRKKASIVSTVEENENIIKVLENKMKLMVGSSLEKEAKETEENKNVESKQQSLAASQTVDSQISHENHASSFTLMEYKIMIDEKKQNILSLKAVLESTERDLLRNEEIVLESEDTHAESVTLLKKNHILLRNSIICLAIAANYASRFQFEIFISKLSTQVIGKLLFILTPQEKKNDSLFWAMAHLLGVLVKMNEKWKATIRDSDIMIYLLDRLHYFLKQKYPHFNENLNEGLNNISSEDNHSAESVNDYVDEVHSYNSKESRSQKSCQSVESNTFSFSDQTAFSDSKNSDLAANSSSTSIHSKISETSIVSELLEEERIQPCNQCIDHLIQVIYWLVYDCHISSHSIFHHKSFAYLVQYAGLQINDGSINRGESGDYINRNPSLLSFSNNENFQPYPGSALCNIKPQEHNASTTSFSSSSKSASSTYSAKASNTSLVPPANLSSNSLLSMDTTDESLASKSTNDRSFISADRGCVYCLPNNIISSFEGSQKADDESKEKSSTGSSVSGSQKSNIQMKNSGPDNIGEDIIDEEENLDEGLWVRGGHFEVILHGGSNTFLEKPNELDILIQVLKFIPEALGVLLGCGALYGLLLKLKISTGYITIAQDNSLAQSVPCSSSSLDITVSCVLLLANMLLPMPLPPDLFPSKLQAHNNLTIEEQPSIYKHVSFNCMQLGIHYILQDLILGILHSGELHLPAGPHGLTLWDASCLSLGRLCLSSNPVKNSILNYQKGAIISVISKHILLHAKLQPIMEHQRQQNFKKNIGQDILNREKNYENDYHEDNKEISDVLKEKDSKWGYSLALTYNSLSSIIMNHTPLKKKLFPIKDEFLAVIKNNLQPNMDEDHFLLQAQSCRCLSALLMVNSEATTHLKTGEGNPQGFQIVGERSCKEMDDDVIREYKERFCSLEISTCLLRLIESGNDDAVYIYSLQALIASLINCYQAQCWWEHDSNYRSIGRILDGKRIPGGITTKNMALRLLRRLAQGNNQNRAFIRNANIIPSICKLLMHKRDETIVKSAVICVEDITHRNLRNWQDVMKYGGIPLCLRLISYANIYETITKCFLQISILVKNSEKDRVLFLKSDGLPVILNGIKHNYARKVNPSITEEEEFQIRQAAIQCLAAIFHFEDIQTAACSNDIETHITILDILNRAVVHNDYRHIYDFSKKIESKFQCEKVDNNSKRLSPFPSIDDEKIDKISISPSMYQNLNYCLSCLCARSSQVRQMVLTMKPALLPSLLAIGSGCISDKQDQFSTTKATVTVASLTSSKSYGILVESELSMPDFHQTLVASGTLPSNEED